MSIVNFKQQNTDEIDSNFDAGLTVTLLKPNDFLWIKYTNLNDQGLTYSIGGKQQLK